MVILASFQDPSVPLTFVAGLSRTASSLPDYLVQADASEMGACISIWDSSYSTVLSWIQVLFPWGGKKSLSGSRGSTSSFGTKHAQIFLLSFRPDPPSPSS